MAHYGNTSVLARLPAIGERSGDSLQEMYAHAAPINIPFSATVTLDFAFGTRINFIIDTLTANVTLANPFNLRPGASGIIRLTQDGTGSRTLTLGGNWKHIGGAPTASTPASSVDDLTYFVWTTSLIHCSLTKAYA